MSETSFEPLNEIKNNKVKTYIASVCIASLLIGFHYYLLILLVFLYDSDIFEGIKAHIKKLHIDFQEICLKNNKLLSSLLFYIPIIYAIDFINFYFFNVESETLNNRMKMPILEYLLATLILAPIIEELIFRKWLLKRISRSFGLITSILASSMIFGLLHPWNIIGASFSGVILGLYFVKTNSLIAPIIAHFFINFTPTVSLTLLKLLYSIDEIRLMDDFTSSEKFIIIAVPILILISFMTWYITRINFIEYLRPQINTYTKESTNHKRYQVISN